MKELLNGLMLRSESPLVKGGNNVKSNLRLQIEQIDNKIQRLEIQKQFYYQILDINDKTEFNSVNNKQNTETPE
jgi:hypothetical protein